MARGLSSMPNHKVPIQPPSTISTQRDGPRSPLDSRHIHKFMMPEKVKRQSGNRTSPLHCLSNGVAAKRKDFETFKCLKGFESRIVFISVSAITKKWQLHIIEYQRFILTSIHTCKNIPLKHIQYLQNSSFWFLGYMKKQLYFDC